MKPIIFSTPMVHAILDGNKTQTRRIIPNLPEGVAKIWHDGGEWIVQNENKECWKGILNARRQPGDVLWVRESWGFAYQNPDGSDDYIYRADFKKSGKIILLTGYAMKWRPSIYMPKAAARIFLQVTAVRAEKLHDITEADAIAEGVDSGGDWATAPTINFSNLWASIHGTESWESNPWVWVITFERTEKPQS